MIDTQIRLKIILFDKEIPDRYYEQTIGDVQEIKRFNGKLKVVYREGEGLEAKEVEFNIEDIIKIGTELIDSHWKWVRREE